MKVLTLNSGSSSLKINLFHAEGLRARSLENLDAFGIALDPEANRAPGTNARALHAKPSRTQAWVIPTDEVEIAQCALECIRSNEPQGVRP